MRFRCVQIVLLTLMFVVGFQNILAASAQNSIDNATLIYGNNTSIPATQPLSIQGIWNISLVGTGITAAVNQSSNSIYGWCKFEGAEPWNGVVAGSLSGHSVSLAIAAMQGEVLVSTDITGTVFDEVLSGRYVSYDSNGNEVNGVVTGTRISPNVADYTPVKIETEAAAEPALASTPAEIQPPRTVQPALPNAAQDNLATKNRVKDVTELARGINPDVLPWSFPL
jgi:hypothetical protein